MSSTDACSSSKCLLIAMVASLKELSGGAMGDGGSVRLKLGLETAALSRSFMEIIGSCTLGYCYLMPIILSLHFHDALTMCFNQSLLLKLNLKHLTCVISFLSIFYAS